MPPYRKKQLGFPITVARIPKSSLPSTPEISFWKPCLPATKCSEKDVSMELVTSASLNRNGYCVVGESVGCIGFEEASDSAAMIVSTALRTRLRVCVLGYDVFGVAGVEGGDGHDDEVDGFHFTRYDGLETHNS
jgi:hypothetical protein